MTLRDYQQRAVNDTIANIGERCCLVAPTGSGKTHMGVAIVNAIDRPTLWLAHRRELVRQAADRLVAHGITPGIILAGEPWARRAKVQVASIQTLARREAPPAELIVLDEAHHAVSEGFQHLLSTYPAASIVGLTATPFRLDGRGLGDIFGRLVIAATTQELCDAGTLHAPRVYAPSNPNLSRVKIRHGDFVTGSLAKAMDKPSITGDIVEHWRKLGRGRTVAFAVSVEHSKHIVEAFQSAGVIAEHLDGTTPKDRRDAILGRLRSGATQLVSNCMVLTEGWDLPELETAIIARPTASQCLHLQMIGRIMRAADGKAEAIVLDHAGNHHRHGFVTDPIEYSLYVSPKQSREEGDAVARVKICKECYGANMQTATVCVLCGAEFKTVPRKVAQVEGTLQELRQGKALVTPADWDARQAFWNQTSAWESEQRAKWMFKQKFGEWPIVVDGQLVDPARATLEQRQAVYAQLLTVAREKGYREGWALAIFREKFNGRKVEGAATAASV